MSERREHVADETEFSRFSNDIRQLPAHCRK